MTLPIREEQGVIIDSEDNIIRHRLHDVRSAHFKKEEDDFTNLIVKAVNSHTELLSFLEEILDDHKNLCFMEDFQTRAEKLIAKARGIKPEPV